MLQDCQRNECQWIRGLKSCFWFGWKKNLSDNTVRKLIICKKAQVWCANLCKKSGKPSELQEQLRLVWKIQDIELINGHRELITEKLLQEWNHSNSGGNCIRGGTSIKIEICYYWQGLSDFVEGNQPYKLMNKVY